MSSPATSISVPAELAQLKCLASDRAQLREQIERLTEAVRDSESGRVALRQQIEALFSRRASRWLTQLANWPELTNLSELLRRDETQ